MLTVSRVVIDVIVEYADDGDGAVIQERPIIALRQRIDLGGEAHAAVIAARHRRLVPGHPYPCDTVGFARIEVDAHNGKRVGLILSLVTAAAGSAPGTTTESAAEITSAPTGVPTARALCGLRALASLPLLPTLTRLPALPRRSSAAPSALIARPEHLRETRPATGLPLAVHQLPFAIERVRTKVDR